MSIRLTVVLSASPSLSYPPPERRADAIHPASRSFPVSRYGETTKNPDAECLKPSAGAAYGVSAGVGAGHPPSKAGGHAARPLTWWGLEKWGAFLVFGREGVRCG